MVLDTARTTSDSVADHVSDHNTLHGFYNDSLNAVGIVYVSKTGSDSNDGQTWATAWLIVAHATATAPTKSEIRVGVGEFVEDTQINWRQQQSIIGAGPGSTVIKLADGTDADLIVSDTSFATTDYHHNAAIRNLRLEGNKANNSSGSGIVFNSRVGENTLLMNLVVQNFVGDNIKCNNGGQPFFWRDVHTFSSDGYGISLSRTGGDRFQSVVLEKISGDNNASGLIHLNGLAASEDENELIIGVKPETSVAGKQQDVIVLTDTQCAVTLMGGNIQLSQSINSPSLK